MSVRALLLGSALALLPAVALAQSNTPNGAISQGQVWTSAQWNLAWQSKLDYPPSAPVTAGALWTFNNGATVNNGLTVVGGATVTGGETLDTLTTNIATVGAGGLAVTGALATFDTGITVSGGNITTTLTGAGAQCLEANALGVIIGTGAVCGGSGSAPGGANTLVQYNNAGAFGAISGFTWNGTTLTLPNTTTLPGGGTLTSTTNSFTKPTTFTGTITMPDGGTLSSTVNTYVKVNTVQESSTATSPAYTWSSPSAGRFGCIYASATGTFDLGSSTSATFTCSSPTIEYTQNTLALFAPTTVQNTTTIKDSTGVTTDFIVSNAGAHPTITLGAPTPGSAILVGSSNATLCGDSNTALGWDLGNSNTCNALGIINFATANVGTVINWPQVAGISATAQRINATAAGFGVPVIITGQISNTFTQPASNQSILQVGGVPAAASNGALGLSLMGSAVAGNSIYCDQYSYYCMGRQFDFVNNGDGFPIWGVESGITDNHALEIGYVRAVDTMLHVSQFLGGLDSVVPQGAVEHFNVVSGGVNFSAPTATLTPVGCTQNPSSPLVRMSGTAPNGVVVGVQSNFGGYGCTSVGVTINDSTGTGAVVTTTLTGATTNATAGPTTIVGHAWATQEPAFWGFGQADISPAPRLRLGESDNAGHSWETSLTLQPAFILSGQLEFDTAGGAGHLGFTGGETLSDAGSNVLQILACTGGAGNTCSSTSTNSGAKMGFLRLPTVIVSALATLDPSPAAGDRATVSDATSCTFLGSITGGGSGIPACPVIYNGSAWVGG